MNRKPTRDAAQGRWRGILLTIGVPEACLRSKTKNGPCPMCGGETRFRMDDKDGRGTWLCNACGAGDGVQLVQQFLGLNVADALSRVDEIVHNAEIPKEKPSPEMTEEECRQFRLGLWRAGQPITQDSRAHAYFASRGLEEVEYPMAMRYADKVRDGEGGIRPCILSAVTDLEGKCVAIHRTFLRPDGKGKAEMASPRKITPGQLPDGSCVRLSGSSTCLGIAEGIETAFAASAMFDMPVWAALNTALLKKWCPPQLCDEVVIFGDHDTKFGGQAAAFALAHRLAAKGIAVSVQLPPQPGTDWLDEYLKHRKGNAA